MSDPSHKLVRSTPQASPIHPKSMLDPSHKPVRSTPQACPIHPTNMSDPPHKHVRSTPQACLIHPTSMSEDRKSTRLNSSHVAISYAVFCLKKKKNDNLQNTAV